MKEQNTAKVYAKTFMELGADKGVDFAAELTNLTEAINASNDLENVLFLDVFSVEEKTSVFNAIAEKLSLNALAISAVNYLIQEKRISILPLIFKEVIVMDDDKKGFLRGVVEGSSDSISDEDINKLKAAISKNFAGKNLELDYKKNTAITSGHKITVGDYQLDATVDRQLRNFQETVLNKTN